MNVGSADVAAERPSPPATAEADLRPDNGPQRTPT